MPSLPPLNEAVLGITLRKTDLAFDTVNADDAVPHAAVVARDAVGVVSAMTGDTVNPTVISTVAAHGLTTGDVVVIDEVRGNYAANGRHAVTVVDADTFSLAVAGDGDWEGGGKVYLAVPGLDDLTLAFQSEGLYSVVIPANVPLDRASSYRVYVWDEGPYAGDFLRSFDFPVR